MQMGSFEQAAILTDPRLKAVFSDPILKAKHLRSLIPKLGMIVEECDFFRQSLERGESMEQHKTRISRALALHDEMLANFPAELRSLTSGFSDREHRTNTELGALFFTEAALDLIQLVVSLSEEYLPKPGPNLAARLKGWFTSLWR